MKRRKFVLGTGGVATGVSALIGSGAFSFVRAERDITIEVADDENAFLQLKPYDESPNSDYAALRDGKLAVDLTAGNDQVPGDGVNSNARTEIREVFLIGNQGTQDVGVWMGLDGEHQDDVDFVIFGEEESATIVGEENRVAVCVGSAVLVSIIVETEEPADTRLLDSVTIHARAADPDNIEDPLDDLPDEPPVDDDEPRGPPVWTPPRGGVPPGRRP
ncbi:DUF1102 domain-containing protein [Natronococcus sp.]|uniref:DUF1102 domain-containing protein n=1 Tax=Natronococcus sp. TaxID=35747 RepID=UPI0025E50D1D|nr:DUF1102 domain-containing protein [Natronococcus sp.]